MSIIRDFFVKEKPVFTGIARGLGGFGFGSAGGGSAGPTPWTATGGAKMTSGDYVYHIWVDGFTGSDQNFVVTGEGSKTVNYSVVAGGGGGGSGNTGNGTNYLSGGGGGGGGLRTGSAVVSAGTYPVTMGTGGAGSTTKGDTNQMPTTPGYGARGNNTVFGLSTPVVASGGGAGENRGFRDPATGGAPPTPAPSFINGGSGGGSANGGPTNGPSGNAEASPDGISPTAQGNDGGRDDPTKSAGFVSGGGGGAGSAGVDGSPTGGGNGGNGAPTIFPGPFMYPLLPSPYQGGLGNAWKDALAGDGSLGGGGGAGEGVSNNPGAPGPGGGGYGGHYPPSNDGTGGNGVSGTGGGGGGGDSEGANTTAHGGNGGPGCIMIRYPSA